MKTNWLNISIALVLAVVALMLWESPPKMLLPDDTLPDESQLFPYAVIDHAQSRHFDNNGKLSYEFSTNTLKHFRLDLSRISPDDFTTLEEPVLTLYAEGNSWFVSAKQGRITEQGNLFKLIDAVRVWQEKDGIAVLELTTHELWIYVNDKLVKTDGRVKINTPQGSLEATGMEVNLASKNIKLLHRVRGHHEPI